jgi:Zn-dependent protease
MSFADPRMLLPAIPVMLLALTIHEWAHAYSAFRLGDPTAQRLGRMTLNPLVHLDVFGTLALVLIGFGWAKPVPVDPRNLVDPRKDMMKIASAGPISNLLQAAVFGILLRLIPAGGTSEFVVSMVTYGIFINCALAVFNLIPVPPLDGSKILYGLIPGMTHEQVWKLERYGPMVLMGVILIGFLTGFSILWTVMAIPVRFLVALFSGGAL